MSTAALTPKGKRQHKKILIIDDDTGFLEELQEALSGNFYDTVAFSDSSAALNTLSTEKPDLILLDIRMPQKNGFQVAKEIRATEEFKNIPIIILSGMVDGTSKHIAVKSGAIEFLEKPIHFDKLKYHIDDILKKNTLI